MEASVGNNAVRILRY